ncbi:MAG: hypothetical protein ABSA75_10365 [Candidatus Bathyarchaeia archaeon]|jgi:hypothetical protein
MQKPKNRITNKLKILSKQTLTSIALILLLTISGIMMSIPTSKAQTASSPLPTNAYVAVSPNPTGVNEQVTITMWLVQINPIASTYVGSHWGNYTLLITKPDGTTTNLGPFTAFDTSDAFTTYTPDTTGNYTIKFSFPGQLVVGIGPYGNSVNSYYGASSYTISLAVQSQPAATMPQTPLPTSYWQNPINSQNSLWNTISGNWLGTEGSQLGPVNDFYNDTGNFNPYTTVPNSAHIVWTKSLLAGGLIGGEFGGGGYSNYYTGKSYERAFAPPVIINGVLYYNQPTALHVTEGFYAVDLRTGKTLWYQNNTLGITNGQVLNFISPNQEGGLPYLWYMGGTTYYMYDANTGQFVAQVVNAIKTGFNAAATCVEGPNGELLVYVLGSNWLAMWNSTLCMLAPNNLWQWRPSGGTYAFSTGIQWNVTETTYPGESIYEVDEGVILATTGSILFSQSSQIEVGYDATTGAQLWIQNRTTPTGNTAYGLMGSIGNGIYTEYNEQTETWTGYSLHNGQLVWGPSTPDTNPWGSIADNSGLFAQAAYGILYGQAVDGIHALNMTTGQTLWNFYGDNSGANFPGYNTYPFETNGLNTVADGKFIAATGGSHGVPTFRGAELYVVNAYTGQQVWSINGFYEDIMPVADGYLVAFNNYDNQLYCFGQGQTATTLTTVPVINNAHQVLIKGTVTDQSPGSTCLGIPAAGTPAISDNSMTAWMEYLYMQQPEPTNATGVPVTLSYVDPNDNIYTMGNTTSDINGQYSYTFTPTVPGTYTILAQFSGSNSYFGSSAETIMSFDTPATTTAPTATPTSVADMYFIPAIAGLFVLIIIGLIVLALLMLRKRP